MIIHWHPDNIIYVRNDDWSVIFSGTPEEVETLLGQSIGKLPSGVIERQLFVGKFCRDITRSGQTNDNPTDWVAGRAIATKSDDLRVEHQKNIKALADRADNLKADSLDEERRKKKILEVVADEI